MTEHVATKVAQVVSAHHQIVDNRQRLCRFILGDAADDSRQHIRAGDTERLLDVFRFYFFTRETDHLIES